MVGAHLAARLHRRRWARWLVMTAALEAIQKFGLRRDPQLRTEEKPAPPGPVSWPPVPSGS